jgi:hypothetical protein
MSKQIPEYVLRWRENHYMVLKGLASPTCNKSGSQLYRSLRRIEARAHRLAEDYCNGKIDTDNWENVTEKIIKQVKQVFGQVPDGFFVNGDPRGYALKLDNERVPEGLQKD